MSCANSFVQFPGMVLIIYICCRRISNSEMGLRSRMRKRKVSAGNRMKRRNRHILRLKLELSEVPRNLLRKFRAVEQSSSEFAQQLIFTTICGKTKTKTRNFPMFSLENENCCRGSKISNVCVENYIRADHNSRLQTESKSCVNEASELIPLMLFKQNPFTGIYGEAQLSAE